MRRKIFFTFLLILFPLHASFALDLDKVKVNFLSGDYKAAISEGEKLLAGASQAGQSDELYYFLGLSYLKDGNYLRASDIFEIILTEFKESKFKEEAKMGLGDTYFLRSDFGKAEEYYRQALAESPESRIKPALYYRLSQSGFKKGDPEQGKVYLDKLRNEFPQGAELVANQDICLLPPANSEFFYTVQVGCFSSSVNANNFLKTLADKGYSAYIEEAVISGLPSYRVRVGKSKSRQEILELEQKLSREGYPTKVCP
ncbi:MAG TPA: SPOR domain-containing protein [Candidatus Margulisiibacteriota bacterium]|nr:SPOR domain-containing protein [Candidatus Margulisiibacteriota bacterium]